MTNFYGELDILGRLPNFGVTIFFQILTCGVLLLTRSLRCDSFHCPNGYGKNRFELIKQSGFICTHLVYTLRWVELSWVSISVYNTHRLQVRHRKKKSSEPIKCLTNHQTIINIMPYRVRIGSQAQTLFQFIYMRIKICAHYYMYGQFNASVMFSIAT